MGTEPVGRSDWAVEWMPIGPRVLRWKNAGVIQARLDEMRALGLPEFRKGADMVPELQELCGYYQKLYPENARIWQAASEIAAAQVEGSGALLALVERWGFVQDAQGRLQFPDWWSTMVLPTEYMDYYEGRHSEAQLVAAGIDPARFHVIARHASDMVWIGYYLAKGALFNAGVSLLTSEVTDSVKALLKQVERPAGGPTPVWVIGISEDEVAALRHPDLTVVGFNLYFSPVMEKFVTNGQVRRLTYGRGPDGKNRLLDPATGEPAKLEGGQVAVCQLDVSVAGLPVPDASGLCMTNEMLHHNDYSAQAEILREMNRVSLPVAGGGRGWVAGEMFRVPQFTRVILGMSGLVGPALWDAWVSLINGTLCVEELQRRQAGWVAEGVKLTFRVVPSGLVSAPGFVHRFVMCPTQTLICGY